MTSSRHQDIKKSGHRDIRTSQHHHDIITSRHHDIKASRQIPVDGDKHEMNTLKGWSILFILPLQFRREGTNGKKNRKTRQHLFTGRDSTITMTTALPSAPMKNTSLSHGALKERRQLYCRRDLQPGAGEGVTEPEPEPLGRLSQNHHSAAQPLGPEPTWVPWFAYRGPGRTISCRYIWRLQSFFDKT